MSLRELLERPVPELEPWADAQHCARRRFGTAVAAAITWSAGADFVTGVLTDGRDELRLRHECEEPGSERLLVRVICPDDPDCESAWDEVTDVSGLLSVLSGGLADGDPQCDEEHTPVRECGVVEGMAGGWPPARQWPF